MKVAIFLVGMLLGFTCSRIARIVAARVGKNRWHEMEMARHEEEGRALDEWCDYLETHEMKVGD